jgi:hypothetical protein
MRFVLIRLIYHKIKGGIYMKRKKDDIVQIWNKEAIILEVQEEYKRYIILVKDEKEKNYVSDDEIDLGNKEFLKSKRTGKVYKKRCSYGINPLYNNLPAFGGSNYQGQFERVDFVYLEEANLEDIAKYEIKREEHKWEVLERKVGEVKIGDIIQKDNILLYIDENNINSFNGNYNFILICPIEYRFDLSYYGNF